MYVYICMVGEQNVYMNECMYVRIVTGKKFGLICIMSRWSELLAPVKTMYVCTYLYMYVCMYLCMYVCMYVFL